MVRSLRCLRNPAAHRARIQLGHRGEHSQLFDQRLPLNPASQKRPFTPVPGIGLFYFFVVLSFATPYPSQRSNLGVPL
jgi:hypothetical protein